MSQRRRRCQLSFKEALHGLAEWARHARTEPGEAAELWYRGTVGPIARVYGPGGASVRPRRRVATRVSIVSGIEKKGDIQPRRSLGVLAQRDPVSIRLRVSKRVEAIPPPPRSGGAPGGPRNPIKHEERGGHPPSGSGPTPVCAQRVLKTRPRRAIILLSLATSGRHSAENTALPGRLTHSLFVKGTRGSGQSTDALDDARSRPAIDRRKIQRTTTELCHPVS